MFARTKEIYLYVNILHSYNIINVIFCFKKCSDGPRARGLVLGKHLTRAVPPYKYVSE